MRHVRVSSSYLRPLRPTRVARIRGRFRPLIGVLAVTVRLCLTALMLGSAGGGASAASGDLSTGSQSGLPVPRFVSLKSDRVNVRGGPTKDHEVVWVFTRAGLPVEITAEYENWRRIRDWEGAEGWVYHSLLSGRRSAFVAKRKASEDLVPLYDSADPGGSVKAKLEPGVLGQVKRCNGTTCRFVGEQFDGYIAQERLWGVYPDEKID
jgi:SH3-like domain-containing protein